MTKTTTRVLIGVVVTGLAAAAVAAIVRYRRGQTPGAEERAHLDELDSRLRDAGAPDSNRLPFDMDRSFKTSAGSRTFL
ncbi:MAG TPA: hypothetical protein VFR11_11665 [Micromonosporaceae bacterium]|nr:hypothetical protein [Micromonosporaceae bacterium]